MHKYLTASYHRSIQMTPTEVTLVNNYSKVVYSSLFPKEIIRKKDQSIE